MRPIATIIDGVAYSPEGARLTPEREPSRAVAVVAPEPPRNIKPLDPLDEYNAHLAAAIRLAQDMSPEDQQRASEFMEACRATLTATTRLKSTELRKWQAALRN